MISQGLDLSLKQELRISTQLLQTMETLSLSTEELREKCADCIELSLSDTAGYCVFLEKTFPEENYKVLPQERVRIYAPKRPGEAYSRLAAEHEIAIKSMQILQSSLEDYYMKLKERGAGK